MKPKTLIYPALIGIFNAVSEASNQGHLNNWPQWFTQGVWVNKYYWKPLGLWQYWPLVCFTDAFHFFKTLWVITMCLMVQTVYNHRFFIHEKNLLYANYRYWVAILIFAVYSAMFQVTYWII